MKFIITFIFLVCTASVFSQTFTLKSKDLDGQATMKQVFKGFGCEGENISPQLYWEHTPKGTKSFAITLHDESAPTGSGWWHWLVFNIPLDMKEFAENAGDVSKKLLPESTVQSKTDYGSYGYGGPCPPVGHGIHKYTITIFALDTDKLDLNRDTNAAIVGFNINSHTIEKASLVFYYKR